MRTQHKENVEMENMLIAKLLMENLKKSQEIFKELLELTMRIKAAITFESPRNIPQFGMENLPLKDDIDKEVGMFKTAIKMYSDGCLSRSQFRELLK